MAEDKPTGAGTAGSAPPVTAAPTPAAPAPKMKKAKHDIKPEIAQRNLEVLVSSMERKGRRYVDAFTGALDMYVKAGAASKSEWEQRAKTALKDYDRNHPPTKNFGARIKRVPSKLVQVGRKHPR